MSSFTCQRCSQPVEVDPTLLHIDVDLLAKGEVDLDRLVRPKTGNSSGAYGQTPSWSVQKQHSRFNSSTGRRPSTPNTYVSNTPALAEHGGRKPRERVAESPVPRPAPASTLHRSNTSAKLASVPYSAQPHLQTLSSSPSVSSSFSLSTSYATIHRSASATTLYRPNTPGSPAPPRDVPLDALNPARLFISPTRDTEPPRSDVLTTSSLYNHNTFSISTNDNTTETTPTKFVNISKSTNNLVLDLSPTSSMMSTSPSASSFVQSRHVVPGSMQQPSLRYVRSARSHAQLASSVSSPSFAVTDALGSINHPTLATLPSQRQPYLHSQSTSALPASYDFAAYRLFSVASEQISVDLPLCLDCTKILLAEADDELVILDAQNISYGSFSAQLSRREALWSSSGAELEAEIARLQEDERVIREELERLEEQRLLVEAEDRCVDTERKRLDDIEDAYWAALKELHSQQGWFSDERSSVGMQIETNMHRLERLRRTHILNDCFHIWHDGHFGTINSFRLGRLPSQPVDWNEINAAWGLATQLLSAMAKRLAGSGAGGFRFTQYRLLPLGSQSKMERIDNNSTYELFGSSDISLGRLFWYRRFDNGMVAFLMCLKEVADYAESQDKTLKLPYRMERDRVGDMSIKIQFNNEETWTKSLKYMLTNLKWLLAWMARREAMQLETKHLPVT